MIAAMVEIFQFIVFYFALDGYNAGVENVCTHIQQNLGSLLSNQSNFSWEYTNNADLSNSNKVIIQRLILCIFEPVCLDRIL